MYHSFKASKAPRPRSVRFRALFKSITLILTLSFIASFIFPSVLAAAESDRSVVRVNITTNNATILKVKATGEYLVRETKKSYTDAEFVLESIGGKVVLSVGRDKYEGSEVNIVPVNSRPSAGSLTLNSISYLGEFRARLRDNDYLQIINTLPTAFYLYGVLAGEMSNAYPLEALRAQAIAAKGFLFSKQKNDPNYDINASAADQVYKGYSASWNNIIEAVNSTIDEALVANGSFLKTYYAASNGGETQLPGDQWNGISDSINSAYSIAIDQPDVENQYSKHEEAVFYIGSGSKLSPESYAMFTAEASKSTGKNVTEIVSLDRMELTTPRYTGTRRNMTVLETGLTVTTEDGNTQSVDINIPVDKLLDYDVFQNDILHIYWGEQGADNSYTIYHGRHGHGVGLSQRGAQKRAQNGDDYKAILKFYYPGATLGHVDLIVPEGTTITVPDQTTEATNTPTPQTTQPATKEPTASPTASPTVSPESTATVKPTESIGNSTPAPTTGTASRPHRVVATGTMNSSGVNMRKGPGVDYQVVERLTAGTKLDIYDMTTYGVWYFVGTKNNIGYVNAKYINIDKPGTGTNTEGQNGGDNNTEQTENNTRPQSYKKGHVNATDVNFRRGPGTNYESMGRIACNTNVYVWGTSGDWSYIQIGVKYGYMFSKYITVTDSYSTSDMDGEVWASGVVKASKVNLRKGPSTSYDIIKTLERGDRLLIFKEMDNGWLDVSAAGVRGYLSGAYVQIDDAKPQPPEATPQSDKREPMGYGYTTATDVNLRSGPSTQTKILTKLAKSSKLTLYALKDEWYQVEYNGTSGYVYAKYVRTDGETTVNDQKPSNDGASQEKNEEEQSENKNAPTLSEGMATGKLNFRAKADMDSKVKTVFEAKETFKLLGECGDWYYILHGNDTGYVYKAYTKVTKSGSLPIMSVGAQESIRSAKTTAQVNLRGGATLESAVVMKLGKDKSVEVLAEVSGGEWSLVRYNGIYGYAYSSYIK